MSTINKAGQFPSGLTNSSQTSRKSNEQKGLDLFAIPEYSSKIVSNKSERCERFLSTIDTLNKGGRKMAEDILSNSEVIV